MKTCSKCKEIKPLAAFSKKGEGVQPACKACIAIDSAAYRAANPEKLRARKAAYRAAHAEEMRAHDAAYYAEHREECLVRFATYRAAHLEKERARSAAWSRANPEKVVANNAAWNKANPEKVAAYKVAWNKANPENRAAIQQIRQARKRGVPSERVLISELFDRDKGICGICKKRVYNNARDIFMRPSHDHIIPISKGGHGTWANAQLAHRRCNSSKGAKVEIGEL